MDAPPFTDTSRLAVHTITTRSWNVDEVALHYPRAGVRGVTVWRDALATHGPAATGRILRDAGLAVVSLCRGGFFAARDAAARTAAIDDNRRIIADARDLGAPLVVLVCGSVPGQPLALSRSQITDGIAAVAAEAAAAGVRLGIEPLHPMYAADRSAVNTIASALDIADAVGSPAVGVAVDAYHVWWDPDLAAGLARAGRDGRLLAWHVSDWLVPTSDLLNDRGLMGEGCLPLRSLRRLVEDAGFTSWSEVEIFSHRWWKADPASFLEAIVCAHLRHA